MAPSQPKGLYNIHVANDDSYKRGHTFSFRFQGADRFTLYQSDAPNEAVGTIGTKIGEGSVGKAIELKNGIKVWTGVVKDPFYGKARPALAYCERS